MKWTSILLVLAMTTTASGAANSPKGTWKGTLSAMGNDIELFLTITDEGGVLLSSLDIPAQGASDLKAEETTMEGSKLSINFKSLGIRYTGAVEADKTTGTFEQGGMSFPLTFVRAEKKLPGNTSLPSSADDLAAMAGWDKGTYKYAVDDYFAKPRRSRFQLSPNGNYLSYMERDEKGKQHLWIQDTRTQKTARVLEEKENPILGYVWKTEDRLLYVMDEGGNENTMVFAINRDGGNKTSLTPFEGVKSNIIAFMKDDPRHVVIQMNKNNPQIFEPYKLNVESGELIQLYTNTDPQNPINEYIFDKDGNMRGYVKLKDGVESEIYYSTDGKEYALLQSNNWKDVFAISRFNYNSKNKHEAYVETNLFSDKTELYLYDLSTNKPIKKLFSNPVYDASSFGVSSKKRNYELDYFGYEGAKWEVVPVSAFFSKVHKNITAKFPKYQYSVVSQTDDESKYLLYVSSDKHYGSYYLYDVAGNAFTLLVEMMPQLREDDMAEMRPISFKSRDGLTIHGYIVLPKEAAQGKRVPLIVNPHGGPQGVRDSWGFNPESQLFASRGYATLHVNFRISGGYGKQFLTAGFGQIGRKCMDDVEDGIRYVVEQGWVDAKKVAIYGGSHGGYAVLRGLIKTPELYTCGVDYVGVSNIFTFFNSFPTYWKPYTKIMKEIWYDVDSPEQKALIEEVSPAFHIDKIRVPLFVVQGANDPRVNINESDQIVTGLRARGLNVPYMVKYNEGHGFQREENMLAMYKSMMGFLAQNLR